MATYNGTNNNDTLIGTSADDDFYGYEGNDFLVGGGGWDGFHGGEGADTIVGTVYTGGGVGEDYTLYRSSPSAVNVNLATGRGSGGHAEGDVFVNIFGAVGSSFNDTLTGNAEQNWLAGEDGNDILSSGGSNTGYDILDGGAGADTLIGGAGVDSFTYYDPANDSNASSTDIIKNFTQGEDEIFLFYTPYYDISQFTNTQSGGFTTLSSNIEDFVITLEGNYNLTKDDFWFTDPPIGSNPNLVAASDNADANAIMYGTSWSGVAGTAAPVTYSFNVAGANDSTAEALDSQEMAMARAALQSWSNVADVTFVETSSATAGITFYTDQTENTGVAWSSDYDQGQFHDVDIEIRNTLIQDKGEDFAYYIFLHEIGHALGLQHSHEGAFTLASGVDNSAYTVMSYGLYSHPGVNYSDASNSNLPDTPMILDIAAVQHLYGANTSYNASDTTYSFDGAKTAQAIGDGAGNDTIDATLFGGNASIDLREGLQNMTSIGDARVWIAYNANIENAAAGVGNDTILGNALANMLRANSGNDTLQGDAGSDFLFGDAGNDRIEGGLDTDMIRGGRDDDFVQGNQGDDRVFGDFGRDTVRGGKDSDLVRGGKGDDLVAGDLDDDEVLGDLGDDRVRGGKGDDTVNGGPGDDFVAGDLGNDQLFGGTGNDVFFFATSSGVDVVHDFELPGPGGDIIQISAAVMGSPAEALNAVTVSGNDAILHLDAVNQVTIVGVAGQLTVDDFLIG